MTDVKKKINPTKKSNNEKQISGPTFEIVYIRNKKKVKVIVLGTAHISRESVNDVKILIANEKPDVVCVELCQSRYQSITDKDRWKKLDIIQVIKERKLFLLMSSVILSIFQKKMGEKTDVKPGEEIITAIEIAEKQAIPFELIDRDIQVTLKRAWRETGYFSKMLILSELLASMFVSDKLEEEDIEKMKSEDMLNDLFKNLPKKFDSIKNIIITERDMYLSQKIRNVIDKNSKIKKLVAVVGAGHLQGIKEYFDKKIDLEEIEKVKEKSKVLGIIKFFLPILIIMGIAYYFSDNKLDKALQNLLIWITIKASVSAFFALILLAHPLAILAAAVTAPISNFNPILKPGWVAALIEAKFRKPKVEDFEKIAEDSKSLKGFFKNKVIRIFSIFTLPQIGSSIGTGLAIWYIMQY